MADCQFRMEQVDDINAKRVLENHVFVVHRQQTQTHLQQRKGKDQRDHATTSNTELRVYRGEDWHQAGRGEECQQVHQG